MRIEITAIWLRKGTFNTCEVLVEIGGEWYIAIEGRLDGPLSVIVEGSGAHKWPIVK